MIINAIEHGNPEILYDKKSSALFNDTYRKLFEERRNNPAYVERKVIIEYQIEGDRALLKITDQGKGFDYKSALNKNVPDQNVNEIPHGRGISMSKEIFNEIRYNESGK